MRNEGNDDVERFKIKGNYFRVFELGIDHEESV